MTIRKVFNGYVVESGHIEEVFRTLDEVFEAALQHFEGRCPSFHGDSYGQVVIYRQDPRDALAPSVQPAVPPGDGGTPATTGGTK